VGRGDFSGEIKWMIIDECEFAENIWEISIRCLGYLLLRIFLFVGFFGDAVLLSG
jgi:hypothetical protein